MNELLLAFGFGSDLYKEHSMSPLASPNVSDQDALNAARSLSMSSELRNALWNDRWHSSQALQNEFADSKNYVAYMEALATGRCRMTSLSRRGLNTILESDAGAVDLAADKGWSREQRFSFWGTMFDGSKSRQQEFTSKDTYCAFMEGTLAARTRHR